jgi:hypothetical protein
MIGAMLRLSFRVGRKKTICRWRRGSQRHDQPTTNKQTNQHEDNADTDCGFCRRNPDDHGLFLDVMLQKRRGLHQAGNEVRRRLLRRQGDVRQMLHGRRRLRQVLQKVIR